MRSLRILLLHRREELLIAVLDHQRRHVRGFLRVVLAIRAVDLRNRWTHSGRRWVGVGELGLQNRRIS